MSLGGLIALFCLYTLTIPLFSVAQQINGTVAVGASLIAGDNNATPWLSPSGDFAFGFHQVEGITDRYLLSIWYAAIPDRTIVWYPTDTDKGPISPVVSGSKLLLTAQDGLLLSDPQGAMLWRSQLIDDGAVVSGVMNNTGNFMLRANSNSSDRPLWQSFDHPADTLLPGQTLDIGKEFFSLHKENDFRRGRFQLRLLQNGNLVLNTINLPTKFAYDQYYASGTNDPATDPGEQLVYNSSGYLYISRRNGDRFDLTERGAVPTVDGYHRATLNFDGVFSQYFYQKSRKENGSWSSIWHRPDNICAQIGGQIDSGACGFNNICSIEDEGRPSCKCPRGFSLLDLNDEYGSCVPDTEISCVGVDGETNTRSEELYDFEVLSNINWPTGDYARLNPCNEECCRADCMNDCLCVVAISGYNDCWKKKLPLSNGISFRDGATKALIKVNKSSVGSAPPDYDPPNHDEDRNGLLITVSALLGTSVFVNFIFITASCTGFLFIYKTKFLKLQRSSGELETNVHVFTYKELADATQNFKEELGSGAFGVVYKGRLKIGSSLTCVAIKKLDRLVHGTHDQYKDEEFKTEVKVIGQVHHKNLVRLLGICDEGEHRLLVYEFLSNGSLADFLFGDQSKPSWNQRVQIACGIARGLVYLHEECSTKIIHCDIKPHNILLDDYYKARISDFGLAKLLKMDQTQTQTGIRGTKGYVAPEWFKSSPVTTKVDVYSFGVILLELICCRRNVDVEMGESVGAILTDLVCDCYEEGTAMEVVKDDAEAMNDVNTLERFMLVAIWCIQEDPSLRPSMRKVNQMLEGVVQLTLPPLPNKH